MLLVDLFPQNSHMVHMAFQFMAVGLGMTCAGVNTTALVKKHVFVVYCPTISDISEFCGGVFSIFSLATNSFSRLKWINSIGFKPKLSVVIGPSAPFGWPS